MIWIINGLVIAILCFIMLRIGNKNGRKDIIKEFNTLYGAGFADGETYNKIFSRYEVDENKVKEIEAKILEYGRENKLEPHTGVLLLSGARKYSKNCEHFGLGFRKGGWTDESYDDECSYLFNDELDLTFYNEEEHTRTVYDFKGKSFEEEAQEAAVIIARNTAGWIETEEYWADPKEELPF